jgi:integrase
MRRQKGSVSIHRNNWVCRWRENVPDGNGGTVRKLQFKVLGEVTAEHRRNKDRNTGKLRIPDDIQSRADGLMRAANTSGVSVLTTIGQFVSGIYLPEKKQALKPSSYEALHNRWHQYLEKRLASCVLRDYERKDAAQLWREIQHCCPHLSSQTFRHIRFTLRGIFETAKDHGLYSGENPASASLPPNLPGKQETQAYTIEEVMRMLALLTANPMAQALVALIFGSGCRKGEVAALDWTDYERTRDGAVIHVRHNSWRGQIVTTKTVSSKDDVVIDNEICKYVDAYRELIGNPRTGPMFHNTSDNGHIINLDSFARWQLKPLFKKAGIPWKGFHAFRRGNATFLAQQRNIEGRAAATLVLRQSDTSTTEDHYILESKQERRAANAAKVISIQRTRQQAAGMIGNGLRTN